MKKSLPLAALLLTLGVGAAYAESPASAPTAQGNHWKERREERRAAFDAAIAQLPADKAALVKSTMEKNRASGKETFEKMRDLHEQEQAILLAPNFDKAAFLAKSAEITKLHDQQAGMRAQSIAEIGTKLTAPERKILVDAWEQGRPHYGKPDAK